MIVFRSPGLPRYDQENKPQSTQGSFTCKSKKYACWFNFCIFALSKTSRTYTNLQ